MFQRFFCFLAKFHRPSSTTELQSATSNFFPICALAGLCSTALALPFTESGSRRINDPRVQRLCALIVPDLTHRDNPFWYTRQCPNQAEIKAKNIEHIRSHCIFRTPQGITAPNNPWGWRSQCGKVFGFQMNEDDEGSDEDFADEEFADEDFADDESEDDQF